MIQVDRISKSFGLVRAVRDVTFEVHSGEVVGLLGPNGAGKTTTIRVLTGYSPPDRGSARLAGFDILEDSVRARRILGYLPESAPAYPEMSVRGYLRFRARLHRLSGKALKRGLERAMAACDLQKVRSRRIAHLSKGFRQRVGLAAAIVHDPRVLVLDEPTNGLDPSQIREARALIRTLAENRTVLVSSHILPEIERTCDRVLILAGGRLRADYPLRHLLSDPAPTCIVDALAADDGSAWIGRLPGVDVVEPLEPTQPGWARFRVRWTQGVLDGPERLARAAAQQGRILREIAPERPALERVFLRLIETEEAEGKAP